MYQTAVFDVVPYKSNTPHQKAEATSINRHFLSTAPNSMLVIVFPLVLTRDSLNTQIFSYIYLTLVLSVFHQ